MNDFAEKLKELEDLVEYAETPEELEELYILIENLCNENNK
jgi:hypothetical protein